MNTAAVASPFPRWLPWALACMVCFTTAAVFHAVSGFDFVQWDDDLNIYLNQHIRGLTPESLYWMFSDLSYARRYMPLGWLNWAINYQIAGLNPAWYHAGNLLLHCVNAVLVLFLLRRLLAYEAPPDKVWTISAIGASIWAIHPLRVETVAWASSRIYNQALLFALISVLFYLSFTRASGTQRRWGLLWLSVLCYAASLLTYPITLALGFIPLVLDIFPLKRFRREDSWWNANNRQILLEKLPYAGALAFVLGLTLWARLNAAGIFEPPPTLAQFGLLPRVMQAFYIWGYYLWKPFAPTGLAPIYTTLIDFDPLEMRFVLNAAAVLLITILLLLTRRRWPGALTLWATYLILLVPVLGLTESPHYPSDRYSYLVGILLSLGLGGGLLQLWRRRIVFNSMIALAISASAVFAMLTLRHIQIWQDTETLMRHMIARIGNVRAAGPLYQRLGVALAKNGQKNEAIAALRTATTLIPEMPEAHLALAAVLAPHNAREAIHEYRVALRLKPNAPEALNNLAWLLATHPDAAIRDGAEAVELAERAVELTRNRQPVFLRTLAAAYAEAGRFPEAIMAAERARALAKGMVQIELASQNDQLLELLRAGKPLRETP